MYFKILPLFWFVGFTCLALLLSRKIKNSPLYAFILLIFLYFGGSFGYFFTLYHNKTLERSAGTLSMQAGLTTTNLQFAFSLIVLLMILLIIKEWKFTVKTAFLLGILLFINLGLKFYGGVISLFIVGFYLVVCFVRDIKNMNVFLIREWIKKLFLLGFFIVLAVFVFYDPFSASKTGSIFIFSPFAHVHAMIEEPSLFYIQKMVYARYYLYAHGFGPRLLAIELFSTFLFLFFNLGVRFFGLIYFFILAVKRKVDIFRVLIFSAVTFATLLPLLFIQKGEWWNTIQFFYYAIFLANIFTADLIYSLWMKRKFIPAAIGIFLILISLPGNYDILRGYNPLRIPTYISKEEMKALNFLKQQPKGIIYTPIFGTDPEIKNKLTPHYPLFASLDSSYVPAFSGKQAYLTNVHVLNITGVDYKKRLERVKSGDCTVLKEVDYVYKNKVYYDGLISGCLGAAGYADFKMIFENDETVIYSR